MPAMRERAEFNLVLVDICVYQEGEDCYDECVIDHPELIIIRVTPLFASLITTSSNY